MNSNKILDRKLNLRGYLQLEFPTPSPMVDINGGLEDVDSKSNESGYFYFRGISEIYDKYNFIKYRIPFYENVSVRESKSANFVELSPLGINTPYKIFANGEARKFNLTFFITLPHLYHYIQQESGRLSSLNSTVNGQNKEVIKRKFRTGFQSEEGIGYDLLKSDIEKIENEFRGRKTEEVNFIISFLDGILNSPFFRGEQPLSVTRTQIKAIYLLWINLLRVSNSTSVFSPSVGCPIVRFSYGQMYNKIPTVCRDVSIDIVQEAGYDIETMIPNRVEISLSLEEVRSGNFGEFNRNEENTDNQYGWDSVIVYGRVDAPPKDGEL